MNPLPAPHNPLVLLVGSAGSGKDTILRIIREQKLLNFAPIVTATTRPMRPDEKNGVNYHFLDDPTFDQWIAEDRFIEHSVVHGKNRRYGVPRSSLDDALATGKPVLAAIDIQGYLKVRELVIAAQLQAPLIGIFIDVPAPWEATLRNRMLVRGDKPDDIEDRIRTAHKERLHMHLFDHVVVNRDPFEAAVALVNCIPEFMRVA